VSIHNARSGIRDELADSPSLRAKLPLLLDRAYERARRSAGAEMDFDEWEWDRHAPPSCPWHFDQLMSDFWPEPAALNHDGRARNGRRKIRVKK
jgi:Domain of unknown function DUF29